MDENNGMFSTELRVPRERIAVLIGKQGETKRQIEEHLPVKISVDSEEGTVLISGEDGLEIYTASNIVKSIGRGFNPEIALLLLKGDYIFESVNINDFAGTKKSVVRLKGRVIGEEGKSRRQIEQLTGAYIVIFGKTASILGRIEQVNLAKRAIEDLLAGATHAKVFHWLERKRSEMKQQHLKEGGF